MALNSFEDLEVYKKDRGFRKEIYELANQLPAEEKYNLSTQMKRAAVSTTNNIAEGFGRYHFQENIQFCRQSRGSINEIIDDLNICLDENYVDEKEAKRLQSKAFELIKILNGYIASIKRFKDKFIKNQNGYN